MKRTSNLEGSVIEAMRAKNKLDHEIFSYFHFDSRFRKALEKHIIGFENLIIKLPYDDCQLLFSRGQGPLSVKRAWAYNTQFDTNNKPYEPDNFGFEFVVHFTSEYIGETVDQSYSLSVPVNLLDDDCNNDEFQKRFNSWITTERAKLIAKETEKDLQTLKKLVKEYPDQAKNFLQ